MSDSGHGAIISNYGYKENRYVALGLTFRVMILIVPVNWKNPLQRVGGGIYVPGFLYFIFSSSPNDQEPPQIY